MATKRKAEADPTAERITSGFPPESTTREARYDAAKRELAKNSPHSRITGEIVGVLSDWPREVASIVGEYVCVVLRTPLDKRAWIRTDELDPEDQPECYKSMPENLFLYYKQAEANASRAMVDARRRLNTAKCAVEDKVKLVRTGEEISDYSPDVLRAKLQVDREQRWKVVAEAAWHKFRRPNETLVGLRRIAAFADLSLDVYSLFVEANSELKQSSLELTIEEEPASGTDDDGDVEHPESFGITLRAGSSRFQASGIPTRSLPVVTNRSFTARLCSGKEVSCDSRTPGRPILFSSMCGRLSDLVYTETTGRDDAGCPDAEAAVNMISAGACPNDAVLCLFLRRIAEGIEVHLLCEEDEWNKLLQSYEVELNGEIDDAEEEEAVKLETARGAPTKKPKLDSSS